MLLSVVLNNIQTHSRHHLNVALSDADPSLHWLIQSSFHSAKSIHEAVINALWERVLMMQSVQDKQVWFVLKRIVCCDAMAICRYSIFLYCLNS